MSVRAEQIDALALEGSPVAYMSRLADAADSLVQQAGVSTITRTVWDRNAPTSAVDSDDLVVADVVSDTLQTDKGWSRDTTGWNFRDVVPGTLLTGDGAEYAIEYAITLTDGTVLRAAFGVRTRGLYSV